MKSVQEVFDQAIQQGYYGYSGGGLFMCDAISLMELSHVLTKDEAYKAVEEIEEFIEGAYTLHNFLKSKSGAYLPESSTADFRQEVYENWADRHELLKDWLELMEIYSEWQASDNLPIVKVEGVPVHIEINPVHAEFDPDIQGLDTYFDGGWEEVIPGSYRQPLKNYQGFGLQHVLEDIFSNVLEGFVIPNKEKL